MSKIIALQNIGLQVGYLFISKTNTAKRRAYSGVYR